MSVGIARHVALIKKHLTEDLRLPRYRNNPNRFAGHCYIASEALYYLHDRKLKPMFVRHNGEPHWFLKDVKGTVIDITAAQFNDSVDYSKAVGKGFLTNIPSKRTQILLNRVKQ